MNKDTEELHFTQEECFCLQLLIEEAKLKLVSSKQRLIDNSRFIYSQESLINLEEDLKISNNFIDVVDKIKGNPNYLFKIKDVKIVLLTLLFCPAEIELSSPNQFHESVLRKIETRLKMLNTGNKVFSNLP